MKLSETGLYWLFLTFIVVLCDQITKIWVDMTLLINQPINLLPFFDLRLLYNPGAAWSFLASAGEWKRWFLSSVSISISLAIIYWLFQINKRQYWLACGLALVLGGAIGNTIDRVIYGHVIDFIDIYYNNWHWPAFNIADSAISVGAVMLLIDTFKNPTSQ